MATASQLAAMLRVLVEDGRKGAISAAMLNSAERVANEFDASAMRSACEADRMTHAAACSCSGCVALRALRVEQDREAAARVGR